MHKKDMHRQAERRGKHEIKRHTEVKIVNEKGRDIIDLGRK